MSEKGICGIMLALLFVGISTLTFKILTVETEPTMVIFPDNYLTMPEAINESSANVTTQDIDWWLMYRHDPQHTGYSTSIAPNTNQTFWTRQFGDWVRSSPSIHNNLVFIGSDENNIYALNTTTGKEIWKYTAVEDVVSSPGIAYGRVYVGSEDNKLYCLNETNGQLLWSFQTGGDISSSPCVTENKVVFGSHDYKLYCLDAATGNHLWNFSTGQSVMSSPAIADGKVFFGSLDFKVYALNLTSGILIWSYNTNASITVSPSVVNSRVFISSYNNTYCLEASDGSLVWNYTTGGPIHSSPAIAEGRIYIGCDDYKFYCLSEENGESKWNFTTGDMIYSSPAIAEGKVFFGSNDRKVYCLDATTGTLIWSYDTGGSIRTSPAVANKVVFIASSYYPPWSGKLFAFGPANAPPDAANLTITPPSPVTTDNLIGSYDYYDEEGDPENGTEIRWYKDGLLQSTYNDTLIIPFNETVKGQRWYFSVRPKDGKDFGKLQASVEVTIQNSPASIDSVMITPDPAYANDTLVANPSGWFDADGDVEGYSYQWQKYMDGSWKNITEATNRTLRPGNFVKEDLIRILCIPYDGESYGDVKEDDIKILNSPPIIDSHHPLINPVIAEGESQEFNITKSDIDLDSLTSWYLDGEKMLESSDLYIYFADFESAGAYNVTVVVSDDVFQTKHEWLLTVTDVKRDVAVTNIVLFKTLIGQGYSLKINVTVENQGDYNEIFNITIQANGITIQTEEVTLSIGTSKIVTIAWDTTGFAKGNYTIDASAVLLPGEIDAVDNTCVDGWVIVTIPGDVDGDFDVDIFDVVKITGIYATRLGDPRFKPNSDIDGDGVITIFDVVICTSHYGRKDP